MAYEVRVTRSAAVGLEDAVAYIAEVLAESSAAAALLADFDRLTDDFALCPEMFMLCGDPNLSRQGIRKALVGGYISLYVIDGGTVTIIGFFHQSQDYAKLV